MKTLSDKQLKSFQESNAKINIWEGAVRSGKTWISIWRFINELIHGPQGEYAIICRTYDTFKRNILDQFIQKLGTDPRHYAGKRELHVYGKTIHVIGADDERAEHKIRGATFAGAYVDEATIIPETVWRQLIARCTMHGAKIFATTNPDSPFHWLKTDFIDDNPDVKSWKFRLDDNPELTADNKDYLSRQYKGLWFQRFIQGLWVQAEGSIYDSFDEKIHIINQPPHYTSQYIIGVDYGTTNPCAFILIGIDPNRFPNIWVEDEYYFDSKIQQRQKTDSEYTDDLIKFIKDKAIRGIYVDPSAVSFRVELRKRGVDNILEARNEVIDGIRFVSGLLNNGTLKICRNCKNLIMEFQSYVWDAKSHKTGVDKPLKEFDHCFAAGTLISTAFGQVPIELIHEGNEVLTRRGLQKVLKTWKHEGDVYNYTVLGVEYLCTDSHNFFTLNRGFVEISNLLKSDVFVVNLESSWNLKSSGEEQYTGAIPALKRLLTEITIEDGKRDMDVDISIVKFGSHIMDKFHSDTIFITKMGIPLTTTLAIWNFSILESIAPSIAKIIRQNKNGYLGIMQSILDQSPLGGILLKMEKGGTGNMEKTLEDSLIEYSRVRNVERHIKQGRLLEIDFVQIDVNRNQEEGFSLIMRISAARDVMRSTIETNTGPDNFVQSLVPSAIIGKRSVYNLTVENEHEYYANGILVKNCLDALRYALFTHLFEKGRQSLRPEDIDRNWRESMGFGNDLPAAFQKPEDNNYPTMRF